MNDSTGKRFNPPPGWPTPPAGWRPPRGWQPDPSWPTPPIGWELWVADSPVNVEQERSSAADISAAEVLDPGIETDADPAQLRARLAKVEGDNAALCRALAANAVTTLVHDPFNDDEALREAGVYRYHHPLESAAAYRTQLADIDRRIAEFVRTGGAIKASTTFTLDGSLAKGVAMVADLGRLMLRAYNAEAENAVRSLRAGNLEAAKRRLETSRSSIAKLGRLMDLRVTEEYHALRVEEAELTADYAAKKEEEREAAREERERLREERKVAAELAAAQEKLEKERAHIATVVERLRASGMADLVLEAKLADVESAIAQNSARQANIRAGYVYVISNRGSFGKRVVKIGLTRRLEPMERIQELGDASVPFRFDVHALFFSEDAVRLEADLHHEFARWRVNWANDRKEFFFATPAEVRAALERRLGNLLEFTEHAESAEFLQSVGNWPSDAESGPEPC